MTSKHAKTQALLICWFKRIQDLNVRPYTIKLKEENGKCPLTPVLAMIFWTWHQNEGTNAKINKWGYIKLKRVCTIKEIIGKIKRQPTEWEKIFSNQPSDKWFISKIHKEIIQLTSKIQAIQLARMVKNLPPMWETWVWSLGWEDPLEEGMANHSSVLSWRIPMDRGTWCTPVHGVTKSQTRLSD